MLHSFFCQEQTGAGITSLPSCTLLSGPPRSGKTSLLFQLAYNTCAESESSTVVFICKRQNVERKPPVLSQDVDAGSELFERVHMKYVDSEEEVRKYFAAFHLHDITPRVVIIDDFFDLFDDWKCKKFYGQTRGREIGIVRTLALCRDAIDYACKTAGVECKLLLSDTHVSQGPRLLYIYQRWLPTILTIEPLDSGFILQVFRDGDCNPGCKGELARYSLAQCALKLEVLKQV
ncbi:hypothetical protein GOP47_0003745 [Adiantum capillus-veneris]|uniref:Uncharacterized protein n=1 Tax=Adiantum capillus-veneris TaxID=13818 RepID=A0A9D4V7W5_ADICA|nr:hypothetical protein GOP47_0003745 [Adiantum capillus-veneris]